MRFDRRRPTRSYFDRRTQVRMLAMVAALGLVLVAMRVVGNPRFWGNWFPEPPAAETAEDTVDVPPVRERELGEFRSPAEAEEPAEVEDDRESLAESPETSDDVDLRVEPDLLKGIRDDTFRIRRDEATPYYTLLSRLDRANLADVERLADETAVFSVLMHNPEHYRGRLVTIEGDLTRLMPLAVSGRMQERYGVDRLWDAWIATPGAPKQPLHVYLTDVPEPLAELAPALRIDRRVPVRVAAYFFKREAFEGAQGVTRTPMLLGKKPRYLPPPPAVARDDDLTPYVIGFATTVAVVLGGLLWWYSRSDRRFGDAHVKRFVAAPEGAIESLKDIETTDPHDTLRRLSEEAAEEEDADRT